MNPPSAVLGGGVHGKVCWLIAYLSVPLDFSDANFCPLNSGPLDLNRLKIIDDILNRLKCQNVRWQKHINEEPIRKHFISMP